MCSHRGVPGWPCLTVVWVYTPQFNERYPIKSFARRSCSCGPRQATAALWTDERLGGVYLGALRSGLPQSVEVVHYLEQEGEPSVS
jgi:hypothetical protein